MTQKIVRLLPISTLWLLLGCFAGIMVQPDIPTPVPVTPIDPPDGIRAELNTDPATFYQQEQTWPQPIMQEPTRNANGLGLCFAQPEPANTFEAFSERVETFEARLYLQVCGWRKKGLPIDVTVTLPDGSIIEDRVDTERLPEESRFYASYFLDAPAPNLTGMYQFEFVNQDGAAFSTAYQVVLPTKPTIYTFASGDAWIYGFAPNETVQMLRYDVSARGYREFEHGGGITETYTLVDQQIVTVDEEGEKVLLGFSAEGNGPYGLSSHLVAIGQTSGEISTHVPGRIETTVQLNQ